MVHTGEISKLREVHVAQPSTAVTLHDWLAALFAPANGHASEVQTRLYAALQEVCIVPYPRVNCVSNTFQPSRDPSTGWHRRRRGRRNGTANYY